MKRKLGIGRLVSKATLTEEERMDLDKAVYSGAVCGIGGMGGC
jgi:hypothetical protein